MANSIVEQNLDILTDRVAELIINAINVVAFTGAGISTESGIPDFRSPGGIWDRYNLGDFTYHKFVSDPEARKKHWRILREGELTTKANPNAAHYAIAELDRLGKLDCVITQNVDRLHQKAGVLNDKVLELHGNIQRVVCMSCGKRYPIEHLQSALEAGEEDPGCEICHGILKPDAVLFGEPLPDKTLAEAVFRSRTCDLLIVIGSTLIVYPAAYIPMYAVDSGAKLVIVNLISTPIDAQATVLIHAKAGDTMSRVLKKVTEKLVTSTKSRTK